MAASVSLRLGDAPRNDALLTPLRRSSLLRRMALALAVCLAWTFALSSVATAAGVQAAKEARTKGQPTLAAALQLRAASLANRPFSPRAVRRPPTPSPTAPAEGTSRPITLTAVKPASPSPTLLDEVGRLAHPVPPAGIGQWKREIAASRTPAERRALLHLWLGEYALAHDQHPRLALSHFRQTRHLTGRADRLHGLAAYDTATAQFYEGAYDTAAASFRTLVVPKTALRGYDRRWCALWQRHAGACAGYHEERAEVGIPEPSRLDPLCGAAALAASLRPLGRPADKKSILSACRVTGEGSNLQDVLDAAQKLGASAYAVTADEQGLKALPKPLVAFVEHDHFVALVRADSKGVSYLCSDCGAWPGGRVDLTWKQWRMLSTGVFGVVALPGSAWDQRLSALLAAPAPSLRVATAGRLSGLRLARRAALLASLPALRGHVARVISPTGTMCGYKADSPKCPDGVIECPDDPQSCPWPHGQPNGRAAANVAGPSAGDPVNLATLEEEYTPAPDLTVYNPTGPAVSWGRTYDSLRGLNFVYEAADFGQGWSQPYNVVVSDPGAGTPVIQIRQGTSSTLSPTGSDPTAGASWDIVLNGTVIGSSSSPNGWSLTTGYSTVTVTVPSGATASTGYEARWSGYTGHGYGPLSSPFQVLPSASVQAGSSSSFAATGTSAPASGLTWDILRGTATVATSSAAGGWSASYSSGSLTVSAPAWATAGTYTVRVQYSGGNASADFLVAPVSHALVSGAKYLYLPNGARLSLSAPSVPSATNTHVTCTAAAGVPVLAEWDYDSGLNADYFVITWPDRTRWTTTPYVNGCKCYLLGKIEDGNGNAIFLNHDAGVTQTPYTGASSISWPLLSSITDASGSALLTVAHDSTTGQVTSVSDRYGRSVYYQSGSYSTVNVGTYYPQSYQLVDHVSQVVTTGTTSPPDRYAYGYQAVNTGEGAEETPTLHTITVPSPTGTGTKTATINYDGSGFVSSVVDANGNTHSYSVVDGTHTQVTVTDASSNTVYQYTVGFDSNMSGTTETDGAGNTAGSKAYSDPNDPYRPSSVTDGNGKTASYTWDQYGNLLTETPPSNTTRTPATTTYTYSYTNFALGELTSVQQGSKTATGYTYFEPSGLVHTVTRPTPGTAGTSSTVTSTYTYDLTTYGTGGAVTHQGLGNILSVTIPGNNSASAITETMNYASDPGDATHGVSAYSQTPAIGQVLTATDNLGEVIHFRYDSQGNTIAKIDALGNETDGSYNIANDAVQSSSPATGTTGSGHAVSTSTYLYPAGPLTSNADFDESGNQVRGISYSYGPEGEQLSTSGSTEPYSLTYDALYRTSSMADGNSHATHYYYNKRGYLDAVTYPGYSGPTPAYDVSTGTWSNVTGTDSIRLPSYNNDGDALVRIDGRGVETDYTYGDPEDRLTNVHYIYPTGYAGGTAADVALGYDAYGRKASMTDGSGTRTYAYDDADHPLSTTTVFSGLPIGSNTFSLTYTYYPDGRRNTITTPAGSFSYAYDAVGRLTGLTNPFSETSLWQYYDNNWLKTQTLGNGVVSTYQYNTRGFTTDLTTRTASATILSEFGTISYDGIGNRTAVTASIPSAATAFSGASLYTYDTKNQLTQEQSLRAGGYTAASVYDGAGNATSFQGAGHSFNNDNQDTANTYDGNGNPTGYQGRTLVFDPENRMIQCVGVETNTYYGDGFRAAVSTGGGTVWTLYDDSLPLLTIDSSGAISGVNTWGPDGLLSHRAVGGSSSQYYTFDDQGNVCQRLTGSTVDYTRTVSAWGSVYRTDSISDEYGGFGAAGGYIQDATGLYLLGRRFYDAATGRFLTRDPGGYGGGINLYSYVHNNPPNDSDPFGLQAIRHPSQGPGSIRPVPSCDFQVQHPGPGDYGYHCGQSNYGPHVGVEDCIDSACERHDDCTNRASGAGSWIGMRRCDAELCAAAWGCATHGCAGGSFHARMACVGQAEKIISWFCPQYLGGAWPGPLPIGSSGPVGSLYPPGSRDHSGGVHFGPIWIHW